MSTLTEFLKEQAAKQREQDTHFADKRAEWVNSVERLIQRLKGWVEETDTEGALRVTIRPREAHEEGVGRYTVPDLIIDLRGQEVQVVAVARNVGGRLALEGAEEVRPQGRVDITNLADKYVLYRLTAEGGERWFLVDDRDYSVRPFDRAAFEAALLRLFQ